MKKLQERILKLLGSSQYQPLDKIGISKALEISSDERASLRQLLREMEGQGLIARIRKDRYILPRAADLVTGVLRVHRGGTAHVESPQRGESDLFISAENTGTAMNGDKVVARIMHEGVQQRANRPEGRVIRILESANPTIVGTMQRSRNFFHVIPDDPRLVHNIYVQPGTTSLPRPPRIGDKVVVRVDPWESRQVNPEGEVIEVLGAASDPGVDILSIVRKHRLSESFPAPVLREAEKIGEKISDQELERREDLRGQMIVTIDPDDAKDFDDAIHVEKSADGWKLGVHIADVSHYVRTGMALDREAYSRGNSVYLVDRVIPMLPEQLSNGVCSLKQDVDRLVHSVFIELTPAAKIRRVRFGKSVIRSTARLTYKQAFSLLNQPPQTPVAERLHTAWELASQLRRNRFQNGSLDLDFPEVKVWLDELKRPVRLEKVENDISHQLIEEFMLLANEVVAFETKKRLAPSIYRIHEDPDPDKLAEYRELVRSYGIEIGDLTNRREVVRLLGLISGRPEEHAIKLGLLKSLKRAQYSTDPAGHYGLAKTNYTHFTSPIRRYADLVVHRVLHRLTGGSRSDAAEKVVRGELGSTAEHVSDTERVAAEAEKESVRLKKIEYFQQQIDSRKPGSFHAVIVDVRSYGMLVELPEFLVSGLVHVSALSDDFYVFDPARLSFVGRRTKRVYKLGETLEVTVARVDIFKQQIDFVPAGEIAKTPARPVQQRRRRR